MQSLEIQRGDGDETEEARDPAPLPGAGWGSDSCGAPSSVTPARVSFETHHCALGGVWVVKDHRAI